MAAEVSDNEEPCPSRLWLFNPYSCDPKITTNIFPAVILDYSFVSHNYGPKRRIASKATKESYYHSLHAGSSSGRG